MIPSQRHRFDIPEDVAYLNCAYMSPLMHAVVAAGEQGVRRKARPWEITSADFFSDTERARECFARMVGGDADGVAVVPAASYGIAVAARNLPLRRDEAVLVLEDQFPSNVHVWRAAARAAQAELRTVLRPADADWTAAVLERLEEGVRVVALPHCHWTDGALIDLEAVGARCREVGAALVVDATQSLGALPLDVARVQPDFLVAASYKWLLGPYSLGFLWVAPRWRDGEPLEHNWIARAGAEDFSRLVDYRDDFQSGARRFDVGERSSFHLMPMALVALEQLLEWRVERIAATLRARTEAIEERAAALGLLALPAHRRAGHYLGLRRPEGLPADLPSALAGRGVHVSVRGDSMRVTPHLWTTDEDVERLLAALDELLP